MKKILFVLIVAFIILPALSKAQEKSKRIFTYTFLGMKTNEEAQNIDKEIRCMKGVLSTKTIFKDAEHHAKLMIEMEKQKPVTASENKEKKIQKAEKSEIITQEDLKELLLKHNYSPADFRESIVNRTSM